MAERAAEKAAFPPVGAAVLGLGRWSRQLARSIQRVESLRLLTCYSRTEEARLSFASEFGCDAAPSLEAALAQPGVEAVFIAAPSSAHLELTQASARQGKHVFVEKPMANTLAEARQMAEECQGRGLVLMVGHEMRRFASSRTIKQMLEGERLGSVAAASAVITLAGTFSPDNWRCHRDTNRGGALMQLGIHQIETLIYLLGPVVEVRGFFAHQAAPVDIDDTTIAQLTFANGTAGVVLSTYVSPSSYEIHLYGDAANLDCVVDMSVWPDALKVDLNTRLTLRSRQGEERIALKPRDALAEQAQEFAYSVRGLAQPETGAAEGLAALAVVEAALHSFESGTPVNPLDL